MAEVMEHNSNSFELFGLDFVIDQDLRCWLIEANMSPACAERKTQQWLSDMTADMADGMINIIEDKIVKQLAAHKTEYNGPLKEKIENSGKTAVDIKNWELMSQDLAAEEACRSRPHGLRAQRQSFVKPKTLSFFQTQPKFKSPFQKLQFEELEIQGRKANLKFEMALDTQFAIAQSIVFIQRVWRGWRVRKMVAQQQTFDLMLVQRKHNWNAFTKIFFGACSRCQERDTTSSLANYAFVLIQQVYWEKRILAIADGVNKIEIIQTRFREFLQSKLHREQNELSENGAPILATSRMLHEGTGNPLLADPDEPGRVSHMIQPSPMSMLQPSTTMPQSSIGMASSSTKEFSSQPNLARDRGKKRTAKKAVKTTKFRHSKVMTGRSSLLVDPFLLLNYASLGVQMEIPAAGRHFHMIGGMIVKRANPENPLYQEVLDRREHEMQVAIEQYKSTSLGTIDKYPSPSRRNLKNYHKSIYDIYNDAKPTSGFKQKKDKFKPIKEPPSYMPALRPEKQFSLSKQSKGVFGEKSSLLKPFKQKQSAYSISNYVHMLNQPVHRSSQASMYHSEAHPEKPSLEQHKQPRLDRSPYTLYSSSSKNQNSKSKNDKFAEYKESPQLLQNQRSKKHIWTRQLIQQRGGAQSIISKISTGVLHNR